MIPAGRNVRAAAALVRPVTMSKTAATIITKGNDRNSEFLARNGRGVVLLTPKDGQARAKEPPDDEDRTDEPDGRRRPAARRRRQEPGEQLADPELINEQEPQQGPQRSEVGGRHQLLAAHADGPIVIAQGLNDINLDVADQEKPDRRERVKFPGKTCQRK